MIGEIYSSITMLYIFCFNQVLPDNLHTTRTDNQDIAFASEDILYILDNYEWQHRPLSSITR